MRTAASPTTITEAGDVVARISSATTKSFRIDKWLGLNEAQDGDTKLKYGEASSAMNWRVTKDRSLRRRPGTKTVASVEGGVRCLWSGYVAENEVMLAIGGGALWRINDASGSFTAEKLGTLGGTGAASIFGFDEKAYILTGSEYKVWDGTTLADVSGYVPIVSVAVSPAGGGTVLEEVNKLNGSRRCRFSPDGTSTAFVLPEKGLSSIDSVKNLTTGAVMSGYTKDLTNGKVTFTTAPSQGVSTIEVAWTVAETFREQITRMRFCEMYNGSNDNRLFLYGDGSNKAYYSGIDYDGKPRADYFPDMNELAVGEANTPLTGLLRHYARMAAFKTDGTWSIQYDYITLADGTVKPAFYTIPVNRNIGNEAPGQVQLVLNSPRTIFAGAVYEWKNYSSYAENLTTDERQAKHLSDRVDKTLKSFNTAECVCWDDNATQEYYIVSGSNALVHNYTADAWYLYANFPATAFTRFRAELFVADAQGRIRHVSEQYMDDDGTIINAYWESGSIDFGTPTRVKSFAELWATCAPTENGRVDIGATTDRSSQSTQIVTGGTGDTFDFNTLDFEAFCFDYDRLPSFSHLRLRLRRFTYCKLQLQAIEADSHASVESVNLNVVFGGESH